jgi:RimJ/RimL family protein N-acetyltransferase
MDQPTLETERLILRSFVENDAPRISELAGDAEISDTTLRIPHPYTSEMAAEWIGTHETIREKGRALFYAIDLKSSGGLIGSTGIDIDLPHSRAEIGYWIGKEFWGRGYATEAAGRLLEYVFAVLKLHRATAHHFARNPGSGRVLEKLGMKREGHLRSHILKSGVWEDIVQYGILHNEYERLETDLQRSG